MIVDKTVLLDLEDNPIKDGDGVLTLDKACQAALARCGVGADGRPADYATQKNRYDIARRIKRGESITAENVTEIRSCVAMVFAQPFIVGAIGEALELLALKGDPPKKSEGDKSDD